MPETDITKMKVADLKRELKLRGLATTGNKTELQDRLQSALIDGEISLEDSAITGVDELLDEDAVLTDEEDEKILGSDENELLKSPTTVPGLSPLIVKTGDGIAMSSDDALVSPTTPVTAAKKIVLKRKNSFTSTNNAVSSTQIGGDAEKTLGIAKENAEPSATKILKMSERNPITSIGDDVSVKKDDGTMGTDTTKKLSEMSLQQRLELRAKKFGVTNATTTPNADAGTTNSDNIIVSNENDQNQLEKLKKRAERFGCVTSTKMAKIDAQEKLLKRKERFAGAGANTTTSCGTTSTSTSSDAWAEKARLRLERFKTTSTAGGASTATN